MTTTNDRICIYRAVNLATGSRHAPFSSFLGKYLACTITRCLAKGASNRQISLSISPIRNAKQSFTVWRRFGDMSVSNVLSATELARSYCHLDPQFTKHTPNPETLVLSCASCYGVFKAGLMTRGRGDRRVN